ncbi:hypothetical protein Droror1_Dr00012055 [Drosera rotundifolia]
MLRSRSCMQQEGILDAHKWSYQATYLVILDLVHRLEKFLDVLASGSWVLKRIYGKLSLAKLGNVLQSLNLKVNAVTFPG